MELRYKPQAVKHLGTLLLAEKRKVVRKLELLADDPRAGKPLKGELKGLWSLRAWPYRIIYKVGRKTIVIYSVMHRRNVYRRKG